MIYTNIVISKQYKLNIFMRKDKFQKQYNQKISTSTDLEKCK